MKSEIERVVVTTNEKDGEKIAEQLGRNKSEALRFVFEMADRAKKKKERCGNAMHRRKK